MDISGIQDTTLQAVPGFFSSEQGPEKQANELTAEEKKKVAELKKRDAEVRRHEQAHKAAAGQYAAGGPKFKYETGPDGKKYAVGGEVQIDTSEVKGDPEATLRKAQVIRKAALAPKEPSAQDRKVAAEAARMEAKARREIAEQKKQEKPAFYDQTGQTQRTESDATFINLLA